MLEEIHKRISGEVPEKSLEEIPKKSRMECFVGQCNPRLRSGQSRRNGTKRPEKTFETRVTVEENNGNVLLQRVLYSIA